MQRVTLVRYTTKPDRSAEHETLARAVFDDVRRAAPEGVTYSLFRNGHDWAHLLVNTKADSADAVTELPSFKAFTADIGARCVNPPETIRLGVEMLESYGLGAAMAEA